MATPLERCGRSGCNGEPGNLDSYHLLCGCIAGLDCYFHVQEQEKSICTQQVEPHIEPFFTRIFRLPVPKFIWRNRGF